MENRNSKTSQNAKTGSQNAKTTSQYEKSGAKNMVPNPVNSKSTNTAKNGAKNCVGGKGTK